MNVDNTDFVVSGSIVSIILLICVVASLQITDKVESAAAEEEDQETMSNSYTKQGVKKTVDAEGYSIIETFNIKRHWEEADPKVKYMVYSYLMLVILSFSFGIYSDGKSALFQIRHNKPGISDEVAYDIVKEACKKDAFTKFLDSLILPYTLISNIVPTLVFWLNPKQ